MSESCAYCPLFRCVQTFCKRLVLINRKMDFEWNKSFGIEEVNAHKKYVFFCFSAIALNECMSTVGHATTRRQPIFEILMVCGWRRKRERHIIICGEDFSHTLSGKNIKRYQIAARRKDNYSRTKRTNEIISLAFNCNFVNILCSG